LGEKTAISLDLFIKYTGQGFNLNIFPCQEGFTDKNQLKKNKRKVDKDKFLIYGFLPLHIKDIISS
jgi:hypothetical protein